ncbi:MAG TPA: CBS domain-containing protein [Kofleriaceae bacterium]|nr:CBS domain-containing protein [Kofleriaceae bacterium]
MPVPLASVMSPIPSVCPANRSIIECARTIDAESAFCLLVIDGRGVVIGVVTRADVHARLMRRRARDRGPVRNLMRTDIVWCQLADDLARVHAAMATDKASIAVVLDGSCVVGALSKSRIERALPRAQQPVSDWHTSRRTLRPQLLAARRAIASRAGAR